MKKPIFTLALIVIISALNACGGGAGGDGILFVSGIWTGAFTLLSDTCNLAGQPQTFAFSHTVNQNENAVILETEQHQEFVGNTLTQGFSVDNAGAKAQGIGGGVTCNFANRIEYNDIHDDHDTQAVAKLRITRTCSNGATCEVDYQGTAVRPLPTMN